MGVRGSREEAGRTCCWGYVMTEPTPAVRYTLDARPTLYRGIKFRSRLEARWAAFFDLVEWRWQYEPVEIDGYNPDFLIEGHPGPIIVEVKPLATITTAQRDSIAPRLARCALALGNAEPLILGLGPRDLNGQYNPGMGGHPLGLLGEGPYPTDPTGESFSWGLAVLGYWERQTTLGFCHGEQSFHDRISGQHDGGCYGAGKRQWTEADSIQHWNTAGNIVRFAVKRSRR